MYYIQKAALSTAPLCPFVMIVRCFVGNQQSICSLNHFPSDRWGPLFIRHRTARSETKKCPTCFTLFCFQLSVAVWFRSIYALIALSLFDCQRRPFFATFLGSLLGNTNFYFHMPIISGALSHSLSCWPQRNAFFNENFVSTHSSNHKAGNGSSLVSLIKQLCFASLQTDMAFHQLQYHSLF